MLWLSQVMELDWLVVVKIGEFVFGTSHLRLLPPILRLRTEMRKRTDTSRAVLKRTRIDSKAANGYQVYEAIKIQFQV